MSATIKKNSGFPVIDFNLCTSCNRCVESCPRNAIEVHMNTSCPKCSKYCIIMDVTCNPKQLVFIRDRCDSCGICISVCPVHAITMTENDEFGEHE